MNAIFSLKLNVRSVLFVLAICAALFFAGLAALNGGKSLITRSSVLDFIRDPIVLGIAVAIVTFVIFDRWRKLEQDLAEVQKGQIITLRDIREDAANIVKAEIDGTTRKAQAIESRISSLVEDHPWIADITENEFIPDASSCRIVLYTAGQLVRTKPSLAYEYVFSWAKRAEGKPPLEGTAEDFAELSEFCEMHLADEYLGLLVLRAGYENASNKKLLLPAYLRKLLRSGRFEDAETVGKAIERLLFPRIIQRAQQRFAGHHQYRKISFLAQGMASLSFLSALRGQVAISQNYLTRAKEIGPFAFSEFCWQLLHAENLLAIGHVRNAKEILLRTDWKMIDECSDLFELARLYRAMGDVYLVGQIFERIDSLQLRESLRRNHSIDAFQSDRTQPMKSSENTNDENMRKPTSASRRILNKRVFESRSSSMNRNR